MSTTAVNARARLPPSPSLAAPASGQQQLNLIVGFGAGGSADSIARIVGNKLGEQASARRS